MVLKPGQTICQAVEADTLPEIGNTNTEFELESELFRPTGMSGMEETLKTSSATELDDSFTQRYLDILKICLSPQKTN